MRRLRLCVAAAVVSGWLAGCGGKNEDRRSMEKELLLFCGAGIRPPVAELAELFGQENGVRVVADYAGSEVLLSKIKVSGQGDLYMPGDQHYVDLAEREGLILSRKPVCYFVPTILVQRPNPRNISGLADLVKPGVKLGLGDSRACAVGRAARQVLDKNGIPWSQVETNLAFQSLTVNELGMQIQARSLDAVIVWDAIARYYAEYGEEVPIPAAQNVVSTVEVGVLKSTRQRPLAERFADLASSSRGRDVFRKHKYRVDPPGQEGR